LADAAALLAMCFADMFAFIILNICDVPCLNPRENLNTSCSLSDGHSIYVENVFRRTAMTMNQPASNAGSNAGMRSEVQKKWSKFTYQEVSALKNKDDLVAQLQTKYGFDKAQAQRDVDAFANGRQL
jgi:hypothetical protein